MEWRKVHSIRMGDVEVQISESDSSRPLYSFTIWKIMPGTDGGEEKTYRNFPVFLQKGELKETRAEDMQRAVNAAEFWILAHDKEREDESKRRWEEKKEAERKAELIRKAQG